MTNKEHYQRTFRTLHASDRMMEVKEMKRTKHLYSGRLASAAALLGALIGLSTAVYAADLGGIRRTIQLWIHGDQTNAVMVVQNGSYTLTYQDEQGNVHEREGGGVAYGPFGEERPLTAEELMAELDSPEVDRKEDGTMWVYYRNQSIDITNKFHNNICYVKLLVDGKPLYMTIKKEGDKGVSYSTDKHSYPNPKVLD